MQEYETTYVIGHKNPDTDSICSAICYANLKHKIDGKKYEPARAGHINEETKFVLDYFDVPAPRLIENITTQVKDIEIRKTKGVCKKSVDQAGMEHDAGTRYLHHSGGVRRCCAGGTDYGRRYRQVLYERLRQ